MAVEDSASFGDLLRRHRIRAGLTQAALAERAVMSLRGLSDLERGVRRAPYPDTVRRLAEAISMSEAERAALVASSGRAGIRANEGPATQPLRSVLPMPLSSFVGRVREIADVQRLLATSRLVTLTGPGGVGKTRLALEVARAVAAGDEASQVRLVQLASVTDPSLVPRAVAESVGVGEQSGRPVTETIVVALRQQRLLLILDNCEHLVEACAELADHVLHFCAGARILATSRQRLGIAGETAWRVPSLAVPGEAMPLEELRQCDAARLFVERATALSPSFRLSAQNAPAVALLCRRLDGIPLAIELAAARVNVLSVEQVTARLNDSIRLLAGGSRTAPARQQTLQATFAWSYGLLEEAERMLLARLCVFVGGWTLEAAEHICSDHDSAEAGVSSGLNRPDILDLLGQLIDKSLVLAEPATDGSIRYRLLEQLRQFLAAHLDAQAGAAAVRSGHAAWFLELALQAAVDFHGPRQAAALTRLEQEHANLHLALRHLVDQGNAETAASLAQALWWFWLRRNHLQEGRAWLERLVARAGGGPPDPWHAMLFMQLGSIAWLQGDYAAAQHWADVSLALARERHAADAEAYALGLEGRLAVVRGEYAAARRSFEESLTLARRLGEGWWESRQLEGLATVALQLGDFTLAAALLSDALRIARETGDHWARATLLIGLGDVARARGEYARAGQLYRESVALHQTLGTEPAASLRHNLGYVALNAGDLGQAAAFFGESLRLYRSYAERRGMAECLIGLAGVAAGAGNRIHAARLLGAAEATLESLEAQLSPSNRADFSRILARARSGWSAVEFTAAWTAGHRLDLDEGVEEALEAAPVDKAPPDGPLTSRERQVAVLIARGQSNRQIAESLVITEATAERHVANIFRKLGSRSRAQVATWATQQGLAQAVTAERQ